MIHNQKQYQIAKNKLRKFQKALKMVDVRLSHVNPALAKAQKEAIISQAGDLKAQIEKFEQVQSGKDQTL